MAVATTPGLTRGRAMRQKAPKYGAAVDQCRVFQVGGDVLEEGDHHPDDREAHDEMRQDQRAVGVHHLEMAKEDVPGNQVGDAGNDARHQDDHVQPLLAPAGNRVGGGQPHGQTERRAARRHRRVR